MKALRVLAHCIEEIEVPEDEDELFDEMRRILGCDFIDFAGYIGKDHATYVDQEAAFKARATMPVHAVAWMSQPLLGDILVMGVENGGNSWKDVTMTPDELEELILITCTQSGDITRRLKDAYYRRNDSN